MGGEKRGRGEVVRCSVSMHNIVGGRREVRVGVRQLVCSVCMYNIGGRREVGMRGSGCGVYIYNIVREKNSVNRKISKKKRKSSSFFILFLRSREVHIMSFSAMKFFLTFFLGS